MRYGYREVWGGRAVDKMKERKGIAGIKLFCRVFLDLVVGGVVFLLFCFRVVLCFLCCVEIFKAKAEGQLANPCSSLREASMR